jgi:hypothetical protein
MERSRLPFSAIKNHVLLPAASLLMEADQHLKTQLTATLLQKLINLIPDSWLGNDTNFADPATHRIAYLDYFLDRLAHSHVFVEEAMRARDQLV